MKILVILLVIQIVIVLLKRSIVGRVLIMTFRVAKDVLRLDYQILKKTYKFINKKIDKSKIKPKNQKQPSFPKAVNGEEISNIVPFKPRKPIA